MSSPDGLLQSRTIRELMTPDERRLVSQMQLFAIRTIGGLSGGRHRSRLRGTSASFKEHRQYVPGDALRLLDWKLYGKTDRLFIRQYEDEANLRVLLLLDQSGSMAFSTSTGKSKRAGQNSSGISKHEYAKRIAACIATLCVQQQDPVGLITFDNTIRTVIPPRNRRSHLAHLIRELVRSEPRDSTNVASSLSDTAARLGHRRSTIILLSDLMDDPNQLISSLQVAASQGHEVIVFQIWNPAEKDFPFSQMTEFQSLEHANKSLRADATAMKAVYQRNVANFQDQIATALAKLQIDLIACTTDNNYTDVLSAYLNRRRDRAQGRRRSGIRP